MGSSWAFAENKATVPTNEEKVLPSPQSPLPPVEKTQSQKAISKTSSKTEPSPASSTTSPTSSAKTSSTEISPVGPTTSSTTEASPVSSTTSPASSAKTSSTEISPVGPTTSSTTEASPASSTTSSTTEISPASSTIMPVNEEEDDKTAKQNPSENFAPQTDESESFFDNWLENVSWFFQKKKTPYKIALIPLYFYNKSQGSLLGLRFSSYSSSKKGFYFSAEGSKYLSGPYYRWRMLYIGHRKKVFRSEAMAIYDNHYENYFGEGMETEFSNVIKLVAQRFMVDYNFSYQADNQNFYGGLGARLFFRKEHKKQNEEKHFEDELFVFLRAFAGYDSRDNWKSPQSGSFHRLSLGCRPLSSYCRGDVDLRFYLSLFKAMSWPNIFKNSVWALRAFAGSSFLSPASYSLGYSLSGDNPFQKDLKTLRGFKHNRFRGDKMYFAQSEIRLPLWEKYLSGVLFLELGEVVKYKDSFKGFSSDNLFRLLSLFGYGDSFKGFVVDYGAGLRLGIPPNYDIKLRLDIGTGLDKQNKRNYDFTLAFFQAF